MRHGVGIVDHIEDRIVGLKVRDIYEVPAAAILLPAHAELERLVGTIHQNQFKSTLDQKWAYLVYAGLWWEPLRTDIEAYMDAANSHVTGRSASSCSRAPRGSSRASRPTPSTTRNSRHSQSPAACSARRPHRGSSSCGRCSRGWPGRCATAHEARRLFGRRERVAPSRTVAPKAAPAPAPGPAPAPAASPPTAVPGPESEISPTRLDAALERLREEIPASSEETPPGPPV